MFHKIKNVVPLQDYKLLVLFSEGITKIYDVKPLYEKISIFKSLTDIPGAFAEGAADPLAEARRYNEKYSGSHCLYRILCTVLCTV